MSAGKKHRKLSRRGKKLIRRTLGAVMMITAIIIAAIPARNVTADTGNVAEKYKIYPNREYDTSSGKFEFTTAADIVADNPAVTADAAQYLISSVPIINFTNPDIKVYTTGDGAYQFAYVDEDGDIGSNTRYAVILGFSSGNIPGGSLTIPDTVDAYLKYSATDGGTLGGYCAVSLNNEFLYYRVSSDTNTDGNGYEYTVKEEREQEILDPEGNPTGETEIVEVDVKKYWYYYPCYYEQYDTWKNNTDGELYYRSKEADDVLGTMAEYTATDKGSSDMHKKLASATVAYIGDQFIESDGNGGWTIYGDKDANVITIEDYFEKYGVVKGVFANNGNIRNLTVGEELRGIGSYAFYGCTSLQGITLANGLNTIGNYAFAGCINMNSINMDVSSNLTAIGNHAFYDCERLKGFAVPINVRVLCDSAFEACYAIGSNPNNPNTNLDLCAGGQAVSLNYIGNNVFKDCTSMLNLVFPETYKETNFSVSNVQGCSKLQYLYIPNSTMSITEAVDENGDVVLDFEEFLQSVPEEFYIEGQDPSNIHNVCKENAIAFKYIGQDLYEKIIVDDKGTPSTGDDARLTWQVNSKDELVNFNLDGTTENVEIVDKIGPYSIKHLSADCFSGNCSLVRITIPSSIEKIDAGAFLGCHNLHDVIFKSPSNLSVIEDGAFDTQECSTNYDSGSDSYTCKVCGDALANVPELTFTGEVSPTSLPFTYAMNGLHNFNNDSQSTAYITFYSGWPTNMTIKYNAAKQMSELVEYPTWGNISNQTWYNKFPYMTEGYKNAASTAVSKYLLNHDDSLANDVALTENEQAIIDSALHVVVPDGVQSIKEGIFSGINANGEQAYGEGGVAISPNLSVESVTLKSVDTIDPYAFNFDGKVAALEKVVVDGGANKICSYSFANNDALKEVYINSGAKVIEEYAFAQDPALSIFQMSSGDTQVLGNYVFDGDSSLENVKLSSTISEIGLRPFKGCSKLSEVDFSGSPYFTCRDSIIYKVENGDETTIVQCLEARGNTAGSSTINKEELPNTLTTIYDEAFQDCTGVGSVDLTGTSLTSVPINGFTNTTKLYSVYLPNTCTKIGKNAFTDSAVQYVEIPESVRIIDPSSFDTGEGLPIITFYCTENTTASDYAETYPNIIMVNKPAEKGKFTVYFWDKDGNILDTQQVVEGADAVPPTAPTVEGFKFTGWLPDYKNVGRNLDVVAQYTKIDSEETKWTVNFYDHNDELLYTMKVDNGADCIAPVAPERDGYTFTGWRPAITGITKDTEVYAQYEKVVDGGNGGNGGNTDGDDKPNGDGTGGDGTGGDGTGGDGDNTKAELFTLTVANGSGSGSYVAGAQVIIVANEPASSQEFDKWTTNNTNIKFISEALTATAFTMPAENCTVTATYKAKTNTGGGGTGGNDNQGGNNTKPGDKYDGTYVDIDKPGISNGQISSATINGSADNFVVKITDDPFATESAYRALQYEYGDMSDIMFSAMDISLYDSKGTTEIKDTSSISVTITIPIPDSLVPYGGNCKVAAIKNDKLDKLKATFKTIEKVPCIQFTASHFSPYVVYVDTGNLSASGTIDSAPKTGDFMQPKWFLSAGLFLCAMVLFLKKDKVVVSQKVAK